MEKENKNLELEDIERDLYLRTLLTGERLGPLTGKPSIDRPWLINYSNEEIASIIPKRRIYMDLVESSKSFREDTSIEYYNNKIIHIFLIEPIYYTILFYKKIKLRFLSFDDFFHHFQSTLLCYSHILNIHQFRLTQ